MALFTRSKLFILHLGLSMITFTMILTSTVSDDWSIYKDGFHGLFKQCHLVHACNTRAHQTGLYRVLQLAQVLACISMMLVVVYSFVSLLLRQYLHNRVYILAIFYAVSVVCICCVSSLYILLIHNHLKLKALQIGWAFYVFTGAAVFSGIGFGSSFLIYGEDRRRDIPLVRIDEKEMRHHVKCINQAKPC